MENKISIEELHKELDLVQACITRMADNSFRLKEWYISLITLTLSILFGQECNLLLIGLLLLGVTTIFWGLDAFFLEMETLYRWKYEWIIEKRALHIRAYLYDLNPRNSKMWLNAENKKICFMDCVWSQTLIPLYGVVFIVAILIIYASIVNFIIG